MMMNDYENLKQLDSDIYIAKLKSQNDDTKKNENFASNSGYNHKHCNNKNYKFSLYVIKRLNLETSDDIDLKLTLNDIQTCKQLRHPNILQYLYNFVHGDELCIVAPLCQYTSADRLSRPFGLPELAIAFIIKDTLQALDYIHHKGLIHRSIRASHLLIDERGHCLLTGFKYSISCIMEGKRLPYLHEYPAKARPNINWFSPEILEQNLFGYNHKSDIYSLGITCCELANGVVPFSDLQPTEMLLDKLTGNNPRLLDSNCQELIDLRPNEMSAQDRDRYFVFRGREFSQSFHAFVAGLCLNFDPQKRPEAKKLLSSNFIKQLKRSPASSLLDFLDCHQSMMSNILTCDTGTDVLSHKDTPKEEPNPSSTTTNDGK